MSHKTTISNRQFKDLLSTSGRNNTIPIAKVKQRLKVLAALINKFESPPDSGYFLLFSRNGQPKSWIPLGKDIVNIGRSIKADISLDDDNISRFHCRLEKIEEIWEIFDLDSKNGIMINGKRCTEKILCNGDLITIGSNDLHYSVI